MGFWSRLRQTFRGGRHDADIDEEIQFHFAMKAREGLDPREARLRFGNPTAIREETRAMGIFEWLESVLQDARYGLRQLRRTPAVTLAILVSLVVGIGANTAIFSIVDAALLKALPVDDPQSLRVIEWTTNHGWPEALAQGHSGTTSGDPRARMQASSFGPRLYRALAREQTAVAALIGFNDSDRAAVAVEGRVAEQARLQYVSENFFEGLGVKLLLGRAFGARDDQVGQEPVVILSHRFWLRNFGGRADVLGETLRVNNIAARIAGIAPAGFYGVQIGSWTDLYAPLAARVTLNLRIRERELRGEDDSQWWVRLMARLKPGVEAAAAGEQLTGLYQRLVAPDGAANDRDHIPTLVIDNGRRGFDAIGGDTARALWVLLLLVGLVLLIACANVANLLLARAVVRQRESAVRLALGAARLRLLRQQLVESLVLAGIGGAAGLGFGYLLAVSSHSVFQAVNSIGDFELAIDGRVLGYTAGIAVLTALLFGLAPALRAARADWNDALKSQSRSVVAGRLRLPRLLVMFQLALCVTVLVAAGLLSRSLVNLKSVDIGFDRGNIVYASVNPWGAGYTAEQVSPYVDRLRQELAAQPGVLGVATIATPLLQGGASSTSANIPGRPFREDGSDVLMMNRVSDGLFETLGIPLLAGRTFDPRDVGPNSDAVIVDELFVRRFFPNQNPLGQRFGIGRDDNNSREIIGVVKSSRYDSLRREIRPTMYRAALAGGPGSPVHFVIRAAIDAGQLAQAVRRAAAAADPSVPVEEFRTQTALIDNLLRTERLLSVLSSAFGAVALTLAAVGLAGLLAYTVARRSNEIGIRMALGAAPGDVVRMVLRDSLWLVGIGVAAGLPGAYAIGRALESTLFGLEAADPATAAAALAVLGIVAALAAWLPARRAARVDPMAALRDE
jgi:predicted permease